jgi:alpha,alpha-trehalase
VNDLERRWRALDAQINGWWDDDVKAAREAEIRADAAGTLLYLPWPYSSAAGSERAYPEMYGWDTHFINLGLLAHDRPAQARGHILNQLFQIDRYGMMLNGNRTYYLTRSQPPLLPESLWRYHQAAPDPDLLAQAYPLLCREYRDYWDGPHHRTPSGLATNRDLGDPGLRNELASEAETGLDFNALFEGDVRRFAPLQTNCLLVHYARVLARIAALLGRPDDAYAHDDEAERRAAQIRDLCWDADAGFFFEYNWEEGRRGSVWSVCAYWTLWAEVATPEQAAALVAHLPRFEAAGGATFTDRAYPSPHPEFAHLQWSWPAGWPPMHIMLVEALGRYGDHADARRIAEKYLRLMLDLYDATGKLWEKYNVVERNTIIPVERAENYPFHGWTSSAVVLFGRLLFG